MRPPTPSRVSHSPLLEWGFSLGPSYLPDDLVLSAPLGPTGLQAFETCVDDDFVPIQGSLPLRPQPVIGALPHPLRPGRKRFVVTDVVSAWLSIKALEPAMAPVHRDFTPRGHRLRARGSGTECRRSADRAWRSVGDRRDRSPPTPTPETARCAGELHSLHLWSDAVAPELQIEF